MPRHGDQKVNSQFTDLEPVAGAKHHSQCSHCKDFKVDRKNLQRKKLHLEKCRPYLIWLANQPKEDIEPSVPVPSSFLGPSSGSKLRWIEMPMDNHEHRKRKAAMAICASGSPFTLWDKGYNPETIEFLKDLDASFDGVDRKVIAGLVTECKEQVEIGVSAVLDGERYINFTTDGSDSANGDRIINFSVNTSNGQSFFIANYPSGDATQTARYLTDEFIKVATEITGGNLSRVNSIATDTCGPMRAFHREVVSRPELRHVLMALCDSHGLQLFIKDVVEGQGSDNGEPVVYFRDALVDAQFLSGLLRSSPKAVAHVKGVIDRLSPAKKRGPLHAFAISVIIRWGSQYAVVDALVQNRWALQQAEPSLFRNDKGRRSKDGQKACNLILSPQWWKRIETLHSFLKVSSPSLAE